MGLSVLRYIPKLSLVPVSTFRLSTNPTLQRSTYSIPSLSLPFLRQRPSALVPTGHDRQCRTMGLPIAIVGSWFDVLITQCRNALVWIDYWQVGGRRSRNCSGDGEDHAKPWACRVSVFVCRGRGSRVAQIKLQSLA